MVTPKYSLVVGRAFRYLSVTSFCFVGPALRSVGERSVQRRGKYQNGVFFGKVTTGPAAAMAGGEFVEGWLVAQVLGEGAYGEVRLLVHARSGARVALKAVGGAEGTREAALHRALRHPHVLRCLGERAHRDHHYLFLEYAPGGELFERIEPDTGMAPQAARRYWRQLAAGLRYLHSRGVAHRDIKPENLLLDHRDRIKISDFGMATLFRHGARERLLSRICGTMPYAAPEVHNAPRKPYRAQPADVWAAAVVLIAMLAGELPWERANESDARFTAWVAWCRGQGGAPGGVWKRLQSGSLMWLRSALEPDPVRRAPLVDLLLDSWMHDSPPPAAGARACLSQPAGAGAATEDCDEIDGEGVGEAASALAAADMDALLSYSQPASSDDLLLSSQLTPHNDIWDRDAAVTNANTEGFVARRLARVWLSGDEASALRAVCEGLLRARCTWRRLDARTLAIECGSELKIRAWVAGTAGGAALVQFRRWRGCGMQFQRRFLELRTALSPHTVPPPAPTDHATLKPEPMEEDQT